MSPEESRAIWEAEQAKEKARMQALFESLHLCPKLRENSRFHASDNGLGSTFDDALVFWFQGARKEGAPDARTKKSGRSDFAQQNAVDALLAFANIAEKTAPYCWANDPRPLGPERGSFGKKGEKVLRKEVGNFVNQFGLPHMRSDGWGPGTKDNPLKPRYLSFSEDYEKEFEDLIALENSRLKNARNGLEIESLQYRLKRSGLLVEGDKELTAERIFFHGVKRFAKDFSGLNEIEKKIDVLKEKKKELEAEEKIVIKKKYRESALPDGSVDEAVFDHYLEEEYRCGNEIRNLHLDKGDLLHACECAYRRFSEEERDSLSHNGYITLDAWGVYQIALLFRDAIELYMAINGDDAAFNRVLGKIHMELFDVESVDPGVGCFDPSAVKTEVEGCYTIWFESCGFDWDNPGPNLTRHSYQAELSHCRLSLSRKEDRGFTKQEHYGCGRAVHILCFPGETPDDFRDLARKYLKDFLDGLIEEGVSRNCRGLFADAGRINPEKPLVKVNDFGADLVRTLWNVMDLINKGKIPFEIARCEFCGSLMNVARERGNARNVCDGSCRGQLHKRKTKGVETERERIRREFFAFAESEEAVHIGMTSHMGPEMQPKEEEPGFLDAAISVFCRFFGK